MNGKAIIPLVVGIGIAGLGAKMGLDYIRKAQASTGKTVELWTPVETIGRGASISEHMLRPMPYPAKLVPKGAVADKSKLVGRVPHTGAPAGVPILESMLLPPGALPGIHVPVGFRAVAVEINESSGVDNHLSPGCHVDVVGYFTTRKNNKASIIARTILEDVQVAAVGAQIAPTAPSAEEDASSKKRRPEKARAVTLLVKPEQVPILHMAEQRGKIKLSMRGSEDAAFAEAAEPMDEDQLLGVEKPAEPSGLAEMVRSFFGAFNEQPEAEPAAAEPAPPAPPEETKYAWVMTVYNGERRSMLGWSVKDPFQAIEIQSGGANIFQEEQQRRRPPAEPESAPPATVEDGADGIEDTQDQPGDIFE